ncbi:MAG TPA: sterol desaturase family protein [Xanthomonadaceae bacterium]|jgi:sterol desaturase/sphingolipid hydroxylase (fatty acid hydroxylase superfamily)
MLFAIPGFFILMAIELLAARLMRRQVYRLNDAINSIGLGVMSQVAGVFTKLLAIGIYAWVVQRVALFALPANKAWVWISALVLYDFCYYWLHRMGHEVNLLWAAHVVHHQSERYNLSTALRQTSSGALLGWVFYLPMALLGYPVEVFAVVAVIDLLYQYWIHTELVGKLGWFDRVFASPSNHRAHHAVNDRYLDRNYGGIFILWDRMFGSFVDEDAVDKPVYGTRAPLRSWNPLWANAEVYWATAKDAWHARRWRDKLLVWVMHPGWRPADVAERFPKPAFNQQRAEFDPPIARPLALHGLAQFVLLLGMGVYFLQSAARMPMLALIVYALSLVASLGVLGALMEGRRRARSFEAARLVLFGAVPAFTGLWLDGSGVPPAGRWACAGLAAASLAMLLLASRGEASAGKDEALAMSSEGRRP